MASVPIRTSAPGPVSVETVYIVMKWRSRECYAWHNVVGVSNPGTLNHLGALDQNAIHIIIDPLTAISMGMVTPEQLEYPPGILAAFNLLSKEKS